MDTNFKNKFIDLLETTMLTTSEKELIKNRYVDMVVCAEKEYWKVTIAYMLLTNVVTVSGVLITALISLDKTSLNLNTEAMFWSMWCLSIALTLANKFVYSFNVNKNYVLGITTVQKLYSEGWSFLAGINSYSGPQNEDLSYRCKVFCSRVEMIKAKSVGSMTEIESNSAVNEILAAGTAGSRRPTFSAQNDRVAMDVDLQGISLHAGRI